MGFVNRTVCDAQWRKTQACAGACITWITWVRAAYAAEWNGQSAALNRAHQLTSEYISASVHVMASETRARFELRG